MDEAGHVLIGPQGELIGVDQAFCDIFHATSDQITGRLVQDLTAPADRLECDLAISQLRKTGRPFRITKRFLRDDGSLIWVENSVSLAVGEKGVTTLMATVQPVSVDEERHPAALLDAARLLITARLDRTIIGPATLFSNPGWDTVLAAYVAEAEGASINVARLAAMLGLSEALTDRWVRMLIHSGILEIEFRQRAPEAAKEFRLTTTAHDKLEDYLDRHFAGLGRRSAA